MSYEARSAPLIEMRGIVKTYNIGKENELEILHGIDLTVHAGEFVAIVGESGSGKSTLMNIIGALDKPTQGCYLLDGIDVRRAGRDEMSEVRNRKIGFVFQNFNLIGRTTAQKNVELPMLYAGAGSRRREQRARELLDLVGMETRRLHQPNELSGGQKQRVAIARSLVNDPAILLADEPTGALDSETSRTVMDIFHRLHRDQGKTIVLITHSQDLAAECPRIVKLKDGRVVEKGTKCKMARGQMVRWLAENQIKSPEDLRAFDQLGYQFCRSISVRNHTVFLWIQSPKD